MKIKCFKCGNIEEVSESVSMRAECEKCSSDLHCCRNCSFYSESSYNECKESQADRVLEKEKANYCDYFRANDETSSSSPLTSSKEDVYKKLDSLFSK